MTTILSIDPSVNNLGVALLQKDRTTIWSTHLIQPDSNSLTYKVGCIKAELEKLVSNYPGEITNLVMEFPVFMTGGKGLIAAQKGYTIDLAYILGAIQIWANISFANVFLYTPQQWKGQKPKSATVAQHKRIFGFDLDSQDECDAKMMLYFHCKKYDLL